MQPTVARAGRNGPPPVARHPKDPDPAPATKAQAVLVLGFLALLTSVVIGGLVPAVIALSLARQCRSQMRHSKGYLTGVRLLVAGERLAWAAIVVVATLLVVAAVSGLVRSA